MEELNKKGKKGKRRFRHDVVEEEERPSPVIGHETEMKVTKR